MKKKIILGITNTKDCGVTLIINGKIEASVNEERFNRKKGYQGFPKKSLDWIMKNYNLKPNNIDFIGCGAWLGQDIDFTLSKMLDETLSFSNFRTKNCYNKIITRINVSIERDSFFKKQFFDGIKKYGFETSKVILCDHHYAHAITAWFPSPYKNGYVLCADGRGDGKSITLWKADRKNGLKLIDFYSELLSPGAFYGSITNILGFTPDKHEGKVTGLSATGKHSLAYKILKDCYYFDNNKKKLVSRFDKGFSPFVRDNSKVLEKKLKKFSRENISYAVQKIIEENLIDFLYSHLGKSNKKINLCLSGGVMANVKLNYELSKLKFVKDVFVFPSMGDGGIAAGGAFNVLEKKYKKKSVELNDVYLGPSFNDSDIADIIKKQKCKFIKLKEDELIRKTSELIYKGKIIGWFQGRMEYGPRALGARSILASPEHEIINLKLNKRLKRSEFMPFAPVTSEVLAKKCFKKSEINSTTSEFMTILYECKELMREKCSAVVHVDNTARPQIIKNKKLLIYKLIKKFYNTYGIPCIINTSFNNHEEPIVCSPSDAINCLKKKNIDFLVINNFLVTK